MEITRTARPPREMADVNLWLCRGCEAVHLSIRDTVLNFTREEFAAFTDAVVDINYTDWFNLERPLVDIGNGDEFHHRVH